MEEAMFLTGGVMFGCGEIMFFPGEAMFFSGEPIFFFREPVFFPGEPMFGSRGLMLFRPDLIIGIENSILFIKAQDSGKLESITRGKNASYSYLELYKYPEKSGSLLKKHYPFSVENN